MKRFLFALILFSFCKISFAQSIIAGQHQQWDRFYDFVPDTSFLYGLSTVGVSSYPMDLNGDGINDVVLWDQFHTVWNWGHETTFWITPNSNSEIAFLKTDTCFRYDSTAQIAYVNGFAKTFNYNDVIDGANTWVDTSLYLNKDKADVYNFYSCYNATVFDTFTYIGVRIFTPDTLYGWIKIKVIPYFGYSNDTLRIDAFACQTSLTGISSVDKDESINIFPNPSTGIFKCNKYFSSGMLEMKDVTGRIIYSRELKNEEPNIDLNNCSEGIYFLSIISDEKKYEQRLIICK